MEFLKAVLGDQYATVESTINAYNEKNKDKPLKLANLTEGNYVDKGKYGSLEAELNGHKLAAEKANADLEALRKGAKGNEALQAQIAELQKARADEAAKFAADMKATKEAYLLDTTLMGEKPKNLKALKALIDTGKLKFDGEKIDGLAEQLTNLKTTDAYLFGEAVQGGTGAPAGGNPLPTGEISTEDFNKMGYSSRLKLKADNAALYERLIKNTIKK